MSANKSPSSSPSSVPSIPTMNGVTHLYPTDMGTPHFLQVPMMNSPSSSPSASPHSSSGSTNVNNVNPARENQNLPQKDKADKSKCRLVIRELSIFKSRAIRQKIRDTLKDQLDLLLKNPEDLKDVVSKVMGVVSNVIQVSNATSPSKAAVVNKQFSQFVKEVGDGSSLRAQLQRYYEDTQTFSETSETNVHSALLQQTSRVSSSSSSPRSSSSPFPEQAQPLPPLSLTEPTRESSFLTELASPSSEQNFGPETGLPLEFYTQTLPLNTWPPTMYTTSSSSPWMTSDTPQSLLFGTELQPLTPLEYPFYLPQAYPITPTITPSPGSAFIPTMTIMSPSPISPTMTTLPATPMSMPQPFYTMGMSTYPQYPTTSSYPSNPANPPNPPPSPKPSM